MSAKIDLIYIDAGGGHRAAAAAIEAITAEQQRPWEIRRRNIQDILNPIDFIRKTTGIAFQDVYNIMLRRGWTLGSAQLIPVMHLLIRMLHKSQVRVIEEQWRKDPPDMVVSLIPHYNRAFKEAIDRVCPKAPLVTVLTDIADYPPHFWIERQDQYLVCGSRRAVAQARAIGLQENRIFQTSGMILHPGFHRHAPVDREAERMRLGLDPKLPVGLVMFGGEGSMDLVTVAKSMNKLEGKVQLILLCGRQAVAAEKLRTMERRIPMFVEGFTKEVAYYMALSDFFIGKPGPGSISEALALHLPVIVERNQWTLAHERYNADWLLEQEVGIVVDHFSKVHLAVAELLRPGNFARYKANAAAVRNTAIYEVPELLETILANHMTPGEFTPDRGRVEDGDYGQAIAAV
jgi:1,2-diacylglycerol 3-beta-galactosyltransferase